MFAEYVLFVSKNCVWGGSVVFASVPKGFIFKFRSKGPCSRIVEVVVDRRGSCVGMPCVGTGKFCCVVVLGRLEVHSIVYLERKLCWPIVAPTACRPTNGGYAFPDARVSLLFAVVRGSSPFLDESVP